MKVGILAGLGELPSKAAEKLERGNSSYVFFSLISPKHAEQLHRKHQKALGSYFINKYHVAASLEKLYQEEITDVFCIGKIEKASIFSITKLDILGFKTVISLTTQSDSSILQALEQLLKKQNIRLIPQKQLLDSLMFKPGFQQGSFSQTDIENIIFGINTAKTIAQKGIGQTIVTKNRVIVAVEAIEGTNECIKRAYQLAGAELIVCKTSNHKNQKFDLPTIGIETLEITPPHGIKIVAWDAKQTLIVNPDNFIRKAQELNISLWAF